MNEDQLANFFQLDKRVHIEFVNADVDGVVLDSDSGPPAVRHFTKMLYVTTDGGQKGKSIASIPMSRVLKFLERKSIPDTYKGVNHRYTIVERLEDSNEVWLQVRHSVREDDDLPPPANSKTKSPESDG